MITLRILTRESIPCWYELTHRMMGKTQKLIIRIHEELLGSLPNILHDGGTMARHKEELGVSKWHGEFSRTNPRHFGFDDALKFLGITDGFWEFEIPTPLCRKKGKKCQNCNGTGDDKLMGRKCLYCDGGGSEIFYDYKEAFAVSASLSILLSYLAYPEITTSARFPQLLTVNTAAALGSHGGSLGGMYGIELVQFLRAWPNQEIETIKEAMMTSWKKLEERIPDYHINSFRAYVADEKGKLIIDCPGNATGLGPSSYGETGGRGYDFSCHNVDNPMQQLTLLTALAALHDLVRTTTQAASR